MLSYIREHYNIDNWTYEDFLSFVLVYVSYVDVEVREEEIEAIEDRVGREHMEKARKIIEKLNDNERIELILSFRDKYFPSDEDHEKLFNDMKSIFLADGKFHQLDQVVFRYLKRIL